MPAWDAVRMGVGAMASAKSVDSNDKACVLGTTTAPLTVLAVAADGRSSRAGKWRCSSCVSRSGGCSS